ncbi:MAG: DUF1559 domain-containing protein [Isosphaeraceae bacterium]|nr:DUF1559 domain-containing protein [Isosphaeraceae bacterium]
MTAAEVIVVMALALATVFLLAMFLPRQRESARLAGCRQNLMQIGKAVALYDPARGTLPAVKLGERGPLGSLLVELSVADFRALDLDTPRERRGTSRELSERTVPGFVCLSDRNALGGIHPAAISYRAATGDESDGRNGAFAPGRQTRFSDIEAADGTGYTALFSERLVGDGRPAERTPWNYALVGSPVAGPACNDAPSATWRGDAGSSWTRADWRSTLYNHAVLPNAPTSCVADDGKTALMGASSSHAEGVNVLFADLSVRTFTPRIDSKIWREWAKLGDLPAAAPKSSP